MQTVTTQGRFSTDRLQYKTGTTLINYALSSEIGTALGIDSVFNYGNVATAKDLKFVTNYVDTNNASNGVLFSINTNGSTSQYASIKHGHFGLGTPVLNIQSNYGMKLTVGAAFGLELGGITEYANNTAAVSAIGTGKYTEQEAI